MKSNLSSLPQVGIGVVWILHINNICVWCSEMEMGEIELLH